MKEVTDQEIIDYIDGTGTQTERIGRALKREGRMGEVLLAAAGAALLSGDAPEAGEHEVPQTHSSAYNLSSHTALSVAAEEEAEYGKEKEDVK